ncbi:Transcriptional regulator containing PAS, AAA-type ATPase, and DNA-binding Fis domains [Modicisalibacter ilicicola DSM 19980]|uniref:Transcriptional regulator containing PAS, AAA-type ATPase, and DNA-binding Fis domains n=1 Tax=Modicisalibacter ilicicola DSM 19980 TaxID=1121942 RepID=A0A1M5EFX6_9GAMM|nr:sigma 54-interacting transcriptional regulator [Halomonas ilicicola]SHF78044.1 Transcriptional regulator containing PAS, AAA-type ATPase, and DNA-binding Fis domains [Halomonas ilicicola DSM 19980]
MGNDYLPQALTGQFASPLLLKGLDAMGEWLVVVDAQARIVYLNAPYADFLEVDAVAVIGRPVVDIIENTRLPEVLASGKAELAQLQMIRGHHMIAHRHPIRADGRVIGAIGTVIYHDTWEWRQMNAQVKALEAEVDYYRQALDSRAGARWQLADVIGESEAIATLNAKVRKVAPGDASVLIRGESGTGKELYAHALHRLSERAKGPFIKLNCAAIPEHLLEAELFGYEEGAFTGAKKGGKPGKFQLAHGGTLFLDEIGDMPLAMQVKLLRVLQDREVEAVGATRLLPVDVRVIAATHRPLESLVERGEFREDLFYRINVVPLTIPPLRERREDIPVLARHLLARLAERRGRRCPALSEAALACLCRHAWPGNVRELENVLEAAFYLGGARLDVDDLPEALHCASSSSPSLGSSLRETLACAEREAIRRALSESGGNRTRAARRLGIAKSSFYEKLARHGLDPGS